MTRYAEGVRIERKGIEELTLSGRYCIRSAGSHGRADVIAFNTEDVWLIQFKRCIFYNKKEYEDELFEFRRLPVPPHCHKYLWIWLKGKGWIHKFLITQEGIVETLAFK